MHPVLTKEAEIAVSHNAHVLARYAHLQQENRAPKLGVYRNHFLVITSYSPHGMLDRLVCTVKRIVYGIFWYLGRMTYHPHRIQQLKTGVQQYHLEYATKNLAEELSPWQTQHETLRGEVSALQKEKSTLEAANQTNRELLAKLQPEVKTAHKILEEAKAVSNSLSGLQSEIARRERKIEQLNSVVANIPNREQELQRLDVEIAKKKETLEQVCQDTTQVDYKGQVDFLKGRIGALSQENSRLQSDTRTSKDTAYTTGRFHGMFLNRRS